MNSRWFRLFSRKMWQTFHSLLWVTWIDTETFRVHAFCTEIIVAAELLKNVNVSHSESLLYITLRVHNVRYVMKYVEDTGGFAPLNIFIAIFNSIYNSSRCSSCLIFPLPRTCTNCVRAFEHINYLLTLTFERDAFFVLTPTDRVSAVFTSLSCCHGNRQNLPVRKRPQS